MGFGTRGQSGAMRWAGLTCFFVVLGLLCACASPGKIRLPEASTDQKEGYYSTTGGDMDDAPRDAKSKERRAIAGLRKESSRAPAPPSPVKLEDKQGQTETAEERMVIYRADCELRVESVASAVKSLAAVVESLGGSVESSATSDQSRAAVVVLRVPVASFEPGLAKILALGEVVRKEISAADVTMEFRDTTLRLQSAEKVRDRLYDLLKKSINIKERVKILQEIARLTTLIDTMKSRLAYLKSSADFSTITVNLRAKVVQTATRFLPSPFSWIAALNPEKRTVLRISGLEYAVPEGLYHQRRDFLKGRAPLMSNPTGSLSLSLGWTKNDPPADQAFWTEALRRELENRKYLKLAADTVTAAAGPVFARFTAELGGARMYAVAVARQGARIIVAEAYYPAGTERAESERLFESFLKGVRVK